MCVGRKGFYKGKNIKRISLFPISCIMHAFVCVYVKHYNRLTYGFSSCQKGTVTAHTYLAYNNA